MRIDVYHHIDLPGLVELRTLLENLSMKTDEAVALIGTIKQNLDDSVAELNKAQGEVLQKIADLQTAVANAENVPQSVVDALSALQASVPALQSTAKALDDIVPDAPASPPPG